MKNANTFLKRRKIFGVIDSKLPHIRWNCEPAEAGEQHMEDQKVLYNFFIKYRNPEIILNKILNEFQKVEFGPSLEQILKIKGSVSGTVNDYLFVSYNANRSLGNLKFDFTILPIIKDSNLTNKYRKRGNVEKYIERFIS